MTKSFHPNPLFRLARAGMRPPMPVLQRVAGPPPVIDGQQLDAYVHWLLWVERHSPVPMVMHSPRFTVSQRRLITSHSSSIGVPKARGVSTADQSIDGPGGPIPIRTYLAGGRTGRPVLLYFHGGGWVIGGLHTHDAQCRMLARITGATVVAVDYRLAPEHPHPAAVQDCVAAYEWAARQGEVAVLGDSAGGNLAAVVSLVVRDRGDLPMPIAQGLIYPATDLRLVSRSHALFSEDFILTTEEMGWFRSHYAPRPEQWEDPTVSPLLADRFDGLPPTRIWTAGFDPLRDEGEAYGAALAEAGVPTWLRREPSMVHAFFSIGALPDGMRRIARICHEMGALMAGRTPG